MVVSVQYQVSSVLVKQFPKGLSGHPLLADAVRRTEGGLVPVGECARGMICLEILFQPCEFGGKPGASGRAAARLRRALNIERNQVPCAQVVRVPGSSGFNTNVAPSSFSRSCFSLLCERATTVWPIAAASPTVKGLPNTYRAFGRMHVIWSQPRITAIREPRCDKSRLLPYAPPHTSDSVRGRGSPETGAIPIHPEQTGIE